MGGSSTISTSETRIEALKFQSSAYGVVLPVVYGVTRIPGNLMWYGGFKSIAHTTTQSQGGKGGSVKTQNTSYTYTAAVMMGLCEGEITGISQLWRGKTLYQGGPTPSQIISTSQNYTIPVGGGSITVTNSATYSADAGVMSPTGGGENGSSSYQMAEGYEYTRVGGTYTFPSSYLDGQTVTINYQYTQAGAQQSALTQVGLSLAKGAVAQSVWSYLTTNFSAQALGYSGISYVYSSAYDLGTSASIDNHNFEVQAQLAYSISTTVPDADTSQVGYDIVTNYRYGVAGFPATKLGSTGQWSNYCRAAGLLMSPAFTEQESAATVLKRLTDLTNTALVWSEGVLKFIPYGDTALTANGATYTPNTTPIYDLTDDHFIDREEPVRVSRKPQSDAYNQIQIEFLNRANQYNVEIAEAKDQANIDTYGLRSPEVIKAHWVCDASVARTIAQLMLQRALYIRNTYEFKLPWNFVLLEPMDIVTLTDPLVGTKYPVRITEVTETEDGELQFTAEDFPIGSATATLYPVQTPTSFSHNYNVAPGSVSAPTIFEAPGALTQNGLEVWVAATGTGSNWGGCHVWVSLDGSNYKQVSVIYGGSRYGTLNAAATPSGNIGVTLLSGALVSGSAADAAALNTLCYIGGANKEFLSYQTATLGGALQYTLSGSNVRGVYGSTAASHSSGDPFVRIDDAIGKSGPIDLGYVGKTIHIKLTSFNIYGGGEETLASVTDYTYAITGSFIYGNAGAQALQNVTNIASDNLLSAGEKSPIILEYTRLTAEQSGIDAQATAYGITTEKTTYDNAVTALTTYLGTLTSPVAWNSTSGDTTIVGATFRSNFATVYAARQALLNKIDAQAGTVATWSGVGGRPTNLANLTGAERLGVNLVNASNWVIGSSDTQSGGGALTWTALQPGSGVTNQILLDYGPDGTYKPLWVATSGTWPASAGSGGVDSTGVVPIDNTKVYRVAVWIQAGAPMDGSLYLGIGSNEVDDIPSGTQNGNPYFEAPTATTTFVAGRWYLFVGYVMPAGYSGSQLQLGGVYDGTTGTKVINGSDFRFHAGQTTLSMRFFRYYTAGSGRVTKFYGPRMEVVDGSEPSVNALLSDAILSRANSAYTQAVSAQSSADAANTALTNIASDSILSPSEKPSVVQDYNVITTEQASIDAQATSYGITTEKTSYDTAVNALTTYLGTLSGWNTIPGSDVAIVGTTFRQKFQDVYTAKQTLLNKISAVAGTLANWAGVTGTGKPLDNAGRVLDTRSTNDPPSAYPMGITTEFKTASVIGLPSGGTTYCMLETNKQWTDNSGDNAVQYAYQGQLTYRRYAGNSASSWGPWIQDLDRNAYTGDLNATSDLTLVPRNGCSINGNTITKIGGTDSSWDSDTYSKESYTGGAYALATAPTNSHYRMFGLNTDPLTDQSYTSLDYAWYCQGDGNCRAYESGSSAGSFGAYSAGDVFMVAYDGFRVRYLKNGAVMRTVDVGGGKTFYFDSSFYSANGQLSKVQFGPLTGISPSLLPNVGGGALNNDPFFADPSAWKVSLWGVLPTFTTQTGTLYGTTVASSDSNTGTRSCTTVQNIPVSAGKTYRISVWVRSTSDGTLYLRYEERNPDGSYGAEYYPGIEGVAVPTDGAWRQYSGVFAPAAGVNAIAPRLILAYTGTTGYMQAQDLRIEEMTNTGLIVDNAVSQTNTYFDASGVTICPAC